MSLNSAERGHKKGHSPGSTVIDDEPGAVQRFADQVTSFFRDGTAFDALEDRHPEAFRTQERG
jgi:hypothetical protein